MDPDPGSGPFLTLDPESGVNKFGSKIRDKHPGSSTLVAPGFTIYVLKFVSILLSFYLFVFEEVLKMVERFLFYNFIFKPEDRLSLIKSSELEDFSS